MGKDITKELKQGEKEMKTKAQMNWEVGKEQEEVFIASLPRIVEKDDEPLILLLKQVRQNEYRRGKEDGKKEFLDELENMDFYRILDKGKVWSLSNDVLCEELGKAIIKELRKI